MRAVSVPLIVAIVLAALASAESSVSVYGIVVNRESLPISGAAVVVYDSNNNVVSRTATDASGRFWISLEPGTYNLRLSKPGYVEKTLTFAVRDDETLYVDLGEIAMDYSLLISLPISHITLPVLSVASIPISLSNKGASTESVSVSIDDSCGLDVAVYAGSMKVGKLTLGPGEAQSLTLQIKTPYMETKACSLTIRFAGSLMHVRNLTVSVVNEPLNLIGTSLTSVRSTPGKVLQLPVQITNRLAEPFTARISVSLPEGWSGVLKDSSGSVLDTVNLNPGENVQATLHLAIPRDAEPKAYNVTLSLVGLEPYFLDATTLSILVTMGSPVLRISTVTPHVDAYAGKSARYQLTITNFGEADCLAVFNVSGLPQGYTWTISDTQGNVLTQVYLPAGGSSTLYLTVSVPPLAEPGALTFKLSVNAPSTRDELTLSLGILGRYALNFITQNFYLETTPGSTTTFQLTVNNAGYSSLTNLNLAAVSVPSGFTVSIEPQNVLLLRPGESATFTITLAIDPTADTGDYYVTLIIGADQLDPISRDLHVFVRAASSPAYAVIAVIVILVIVVALAFKRFGRR